MSKTKRHTPANGKKQLGHKKAPATANQPGKSRPQKQERRNEKATTTAKKTTTTTTTKKSPAQTPQQLHALATQPQKQKKQQHSEPVIPFDVHDKILIIGDGDLSFARSIIEHHGCADVTATTYDHHDQLLDKYPQAAEHIEYIEGEGQTVLHGVDATKLVQKEIRKAGSGSGSGSGSGNAGGARWDRVLFNFPHVGGKSTDVNRQVRYNQEMLVGFFRAAAPLLAADGTIVITLFEGEPYTLWNIRDLARHSDLAVQRSFRFQADAYPGYAHTRTLGNIEGGGGWKGEDRLSRSYIFQLKDAGQSQAAAKSRPAKGAKDRKRKRGPGDESSGDED